MWVGGEGGGWVAQVVVLGNGTLFFFFIFWRSFLISRRKEDMWAVRDGSVGA